MAIRLVIWPIHYRTTSFFFYIWFFVPTFSLKIAKIWPEDTDMGEKNIFSLEKYCCRRKGIADYIIYTSQDVLYLQVNCTLFVVRNLG